MGDEVENGDGERRFAVQLFIVHPTIEPSEIETALGLAGTHVHGVGDQRVTPSGTILPGTYPDTRWRYLVRYAVSDQWFVERLDEFLDGLQPHGAFLKGLRESGGTTSVIVKFLGDGYVGDDLPIATLTKLVELGVSFSLEVFAVPQRSDIHLAR